MKTHTAICVILFVSFLAAVAIQTALHLLPEPILHGVVVPVDKPVLTRESWFSGKFQQQVQGREKKQSAQKEDTEKETGVEEEQKVQKGGWFDEHLGFRSVWVKTDNQVNYSLFREFPKYFNPQEIILGKDNWLFEQEYIDSLLGLYVATPEQLEQLAIDLKRLQEELEQQGVTMLVVISPNKAVHYPEYLPDWVWPQRDRLHRQGIGLESDYDILAPLLDREGVNWIDSPTRFRQEKARQEEAGIEYRLFPQGGTHWSHYGATIVAAEILEKLEELTGRDLMDLDLGKVDVDNQATGTDNDLGDVTNTWTPWKFRGPTPHVHIQRIPGSWRPDVLWAGNSYSMTLMDLMEEYKVYRRRDFLFYFRWRSSWPDPHQKQYRIDRESFDWSEQLLTHDIVIIGMNEAHIYELTNGFVDGAVRFFEGQSLP
jgi:hypothetical protein